MIFWEQEHTRPDDRTCLETSQHCQAALNSQTLNNKKSSYLVEITASRCGDPLGARTQDPNIKSVVLYLLS